jgi:leucyl aminopeptidase
MKAAFLTISFVCAALATPLRVSDLAQTPINDQVHPDFDLNLSAPRLVQFELGEPVWVTELDKIEAKARGIKFFDITETQELGSTKLSRFGNEHAYPSPNASETVLPILETLSTENMEENLRKFTSFRTRHYRSAMGKQSQQWLLGRISDITAEFASEGLQEVITINEFSHPWGQNTIIVRIDGSSEDTGVVIISAHQDSTNIWPFLDAPGADDDGSGSVTILEAYRALIASDYRPLRPVEFHWYSAEEGGLLGSQAVASDYADRAVNVVAMSQFDMTAWVKRGTQEEVGVITDFTDSRLTEFNKKLVDTYLDIPYAETKCGYACSDHASWQKAGYPAIFTIESKFENSNHFIHSTNDRIDVSDEFSFVHMLEFAKLAVAFAVELASN